MSHSLAHGLAAETVSLSYGVRNIAKDLSLRIPDRSITVIVGPNGCGKSTLLRAFARLLHPTSGAVLLDGRDIAQQKTRDVARRLGLLPQSAVAPDGILVFDLVARGRTPHHTILQRWSKADEAAVAAAMKATDVADLAMRRMDELSGGQRQRVWIAMALAQQTDILLLDEPTTYLDLAHQIDILDLVQSLHLVEGRTVVMVLHDLNLACRYATTLVAMREGKIIAQGRPQDIVSPEMVHKVFGLEALVITDPSSGTPLVVPKIRRKPLPNGIPSQN
jgi:iron complex transport system ATP-binding protein